MKVVIVDDTHINLVLMSRLMEKLDGVATIAFQSAREALDWCRSNPYDLLILDYIMVVQKTFCFKNKFTSILEAHYDMTFPVHLQIGDLHFIFSNGNTRSEETKRFDSVMAGIRQCNFSLVRK